MVLLDKVPDDIRMDFLNHSTELKHPRAIELQKKVPDSFKFWSSLVLAYLYDDKVFNLDTERFKAVSRVECLYRVTDLVCRP